MRGWQLLVAREVCWYFILILVHNCTFCNADQRLCMEVMPSCVFETEIVVERVDEFFP